MRLLAISLAISLGMAGTAAAELAKWDQTRVSAIAAELQEQTEKAYAIVLAEPEAPSLGVGAWDLQHTLRRVHEEAVALSAHLKKGEGHDQTAGIWKHMMELVDDIDVDARRSFLANDSTSSLAKIEDLLGQLRPYYDPKSQK